MKRFILILFSACFVMTGWAEQITREQALRQAQSFFSQNGKGGPLVAAETVMSKARKRSQQVPDYYYVFNAGEDQGYVIVSGDDRTAPILGYSYHGSFDVDKIPCNMAAWLQGYADQIKYIQEHPEVAVTRGDVPTHDNVAPLISTTWGQNAPYNNLLPSLGGRKCVTGCGATAMAQIMNYHGAPSSCPTIPGYTTETHGIICNTLPATTFNWGNMSSPAEVAKLMQYCAYALKADLDPDGTSAYDNMIVDALKGYFGYGSGVQEAYHSTYKETDWDILIYNEIANRRPVILCGQSPIAGGHFFILHGYTAVGSVGYYTVNWGWDGFEDGNFLLGAMDPPSVGAGFNDRQAVIIGISTSDVTPYQVTETVALTTVELTLKDGQKEYTIPSGYKQFGPVTINYAVTHSLTRSYDIEMNYMIYKDGVFLEMLRSGNQQFTGFGPNGVWSGSIIIYLPTWDGTNFGQAFATPGTYKIVPVSRESGSSEWHENVGSDKYYLTGVVSSDMKLTMYEGAVPGSDPTPGPEVTQVDLDELAALYTAQKNAINEKKTALASNDSKLNAISQTLTLKKTAIDGTASKINTVKNKLNSDYLTATQKSSYTTQLQTLEKKLATLTSQYDAAKQELTTLQNKSAELATTLNTLLNTVNSEAAAVAAITTKAALDASKAKVADITTKQNGCNVSAETIKVSALEATVSSLSVAGIESDLTSVDTKIDNDITIAKQAEQDAKDKEAKEKELKAAKQELTEAYDNMEKDVAAKLDALAANKKIIAALETAIKAAQAAIDPVEKKIVAIKESLKNDMLTAEQKTQFQAKLDALEKAKSDYAAALKAHLDKLVIINKDISDVESALYKVRDNIQVQKANVAALTINDNLDAVKAACRTIETQLSNAHTKTDVDKDLAVIKTDVDKLSLEGTAKDLATLETDVDKAIAGGQEEFEKQQAEKLAKAKEDCQSALDQFDKAIKTHQSYYDQLKDAQEELKAKMKEIDDVIVSLKKQYADIEKMLDELIAKQTRADDPIEKLQESLKKLADNIAELEKLYQIISDQINVLEKDMKQYESIIETANEAKNQLKTNLASATTIADVEGLTTSVTKDYNTLSYDGVDAYNQYVGHYSTVIDNLNILINNVNTVVKQTNSLETEVQKAVTGIQRVTVDESEVVSRYDIKGNRVDSTYKGMQIIRLKNGKTIKLNIK